jgi:pyruvate,orthophosphate dikinase
VFEAQGEDVARFASHPAPTTRGIGAAGGVAVGRAAFDADSAKRLAATGEAVVLMRPDIDTSDVVALPLQPALSCAGLVVDSTAHRADIGDIPLNEGD